MNDKIITSVILEVLEHGDEDDQPWMFYENPDPLSTWNQDNALWERQRFIDIAIKRYYEEVRK